MLIPTSCYMFSECTLCHFMACIETWLMKLHKKDLKNLSVVYHKAIKRICGRNFFDSNHECLEYARFPIFKYFLAIKFICYAQKLFHVKKPMSYDP